MAQTGHLLAILKSQEETFAAFKQVREDQQITAAKAFESKEEAVKAFSAVRGQLVQERESAADANGALRLQGLRCEGLQQRLLATEIELKESISTDKRLSAELVLMHHELQQSKSKSAEMERELALEKIAHELSVDEHKTGWAELEQAKFDQAVELAQSLRDQAAELAQSLLAQQAMLAQALLDQEAMLAQNLLVQDAMLAQNLLVQEAELEQAKAAQEAELKQAKSDQEAELKQAKTDQEAELAQAKLDQEEAVRENHRKYEDENIAKARKYYADMKKVDKKTMVKLEKQEEEITERHKIEVEKLAAAHARELEADGDKTSQLLDCVVCMNAPKNVCLIPCSHVCLCEECADGWSAPCPICRADVTMQRKVFLS
jgi:hypothetical protein